MARDGWFDGRGFDFRANLVEDKDGALATYGSDAHYTQEEWQSQRTRCLDKLRQLEAGLDDETHGAISEIIQNYEALLFMTQRVDGVLKWSDSEGQLSLF